MRKSQYLYNGETRFSGDTVLQVHWWHIYEVDLCPPHSGWTQVRWEQPLIWPGTRLQSRGKRWKRKDPRWKWAKQEFGEFAVSPLFFTLLPQLWSLVQDYLSKHGEESQLGVLPVDLVMVECNQCLTMQGKPSKILVLKVFITRYKLTKKLEKF